MNFKKILLSATVFTLLEACKMQNNASNKGMADCNTTAPITRKLDGQKGTVIKDKERGRYVLSVPTDGTIDEVSMYLICNPDASMLKDGATVTVSGNVRASEQVSRIGGMTYYDLEVTRISK